ncbi:MocR-like pyridoxine biosynthesis transcription factor PdxR [Frigidibacter sp. MR17.24]|uniref:MocR-like pyridoxine biosynthesis transcription factor PdxR n=1 Tax=Frigidibacter sp. MR17.24 TaxID=3127345 RepID=UPI0030129F1C
MMPSDRTNPPDLSALLPVLPAGGPRRLALYRALRDRIEQGALPPGTKLPTTRDLAARFGLSRGAAVAAFEMLLAEGFAVARTGAGTFVAEAVPRVAPAPGAPAGPAPRQRLPGTVGAALPDPISAEAFRRLLIRHATRPAEAQFHYGDPRGGVGLRAALAAYLATARGVRCHPDQIVITSGSQQALDLVLRGVLAPGQAVWLEDPGYPMARAAVAGAGLRPVPVPVGPEGIEVAQGIAAAPGAGAVYVTPSHQFPLGVTLSMARRLALLDWAAGAGAWVIEDDYDSEFRHAGPPLAAMQGMDGAGRVIYVGTLSKAMWPGLRTGYVVLPEPLIGPVLALRDRTDRYPPVLTEGPLADFLSEGHFSRHLARARRRVKAARDALVAALAEGPLAAAAPDQGLHLIARGPVPEAELFARAEAAGLGGRRLSPLYLGPGATEGLVLGFGGGTPEALAAAARRLTAAL